MTEADKAKKVTKARWGYVQEANEIWSLIQQNGNDRDAAVHIISEHLLCKYEPAFEALRLLENAENIHANCSECDGEGVPEECEHCFPHFDDARIARRNLLTPAGRALLKGSE